MNRIAAGPVAPYAKDELVKALRMGEARLRAALDEEVIQLSAFTSEDELSGSQVARPSRRR
jgi:hypothetical protein